ncbi:MAG: MarR family transcriptional regulator [Alphaproteobacteria bacterium]|nr:MarR family transcriptional regulator [Alphaproteobacteria bacterium]
MKLIASARMQAVPSSDNALRLEDFLPYRLSVLANLVSGSLARVYARRFDLTVPEWRVLAVLGRYPGISAGEVAERAAMDKVTVSRAVARLIARGRLRRGTDAEDRRRSALRMTAEGRTVYQRIVPLARAYEAELLADFSAAERTSLDRLIHRLTGEAARLREPKAPAQAADD